MNVISRIIPVLILMLMGSCQDGNGSASDLYKFPSERNSAFIDSTEIPIRVVVDYKLNVAGGPKVDVGDQKFILNAFLLTGGQQQVYISYPGQSSILDLPVTLTNTQLTLDLVAKIPTSINPEPSGYLMHFSLKEVTAAFALQEADASTVKNLDAIKDGLFADASSSANIVSMSLATTLAYRIANPEGSNEAVSWHDAYKSLLNAIAERLKAVEDLINPSATPDLETFAATVLAGLKLEILKDQALQVTLAEAMGTAMDGSSVADTFTNLIKTYATDVKDILGDGNSAAAKIFKEGTVDPAAIPSSSTGVSVVFAPKSLSFTDSDPTAAIGGTLAITPPELVGDIEVYKVYFGGVDQADGHQKLIGTVQKNAVPLVLSIPNGTLPPSGATKLWVFSVVAGKELELGTSVTIVNDSNGANVNVTPSGSNVTISPSSMQTLTAGTTQSFSVTATSNYTRSNTVGGTCPSGSWSGNTYTTGAVTAHCTVTFSATLNSYAVTPSASNATAIPGTAQTVNHGATQTFTVTAAANHTRSDTVGGTCPSGSWSGNTYTTGTITSDCTLSFSAIPTPVDCVYSDWSDWSSCTNVCGGGRQDRGRTVIAPAQNGGSCGANPDVETRDCNTEECICSNLGDAVACSVVPTCMWVDNSCTDNAGYSSCYEIPDETECLSSALECQWWGFCIPEDFDF